MSYKKPFHVGEKYRTNELSLVEGGYILTVYYKDPKKGALIYDNVKNPKAYVAMMDPKDVIKYDVLNEEGVTKTYIL